MDILPEKMHLERKINEQYYPLIQYLIWRWRLLLEPG